MQVAFDVNTMKRICPNPMPWNEAFKRLEKHARTHRCTPPSPPKPLILSGWAYSNDVEKMRRWNETVEWATNNGCLEVVHKIPDDEFYYVDEPSTYAIGPLGGPMYRPWDFETKERPPLEEIAQHLEALLSRWPEIVGPELARVTRPLAFTGNKARRLLVLADGTVAPPWGEWSRLSTQESERRAFTHFRAAINKAIAPYEVDHIDFTTEGTAEKDVAADTS